MSDRNKAPRSSDGIAQRIRLEMQRAAVRHEIQFTTLTEPRKIDFVPLAAASGSSEVPEQIKGINDPLVQISFVVNEDTISARVETQGFVRTSQFRNKAAQLLSNDGKIDVLFQFDNAGKASFDIPRTAEIEDSLKGEFSLHVDE